MRHLDYTSCPADPDLWMSPATKHDGSQYYSYILLYTDDALVIDESPEDILRNQLGRYFELKEESIGPPKIYLGGKVSKVQLENDAWAWSFSSTQYVKAAVNNLKNYLEKHPTWCMPKNLQNTTHYSIPPGTRYNSRIEST